MLLNILDFITGYVTTHEAAVETADGSFTPVDQLRWFNRSDNNVTHFYEVPGDPEYAGLYALTPSMQNISYSAVVDSSTGSWKKPPIVCMPRPTYQWGFSLGRIGVMTLSTMIWMWGMFGLCVDAKKHNSLWQRGRRPGVHRNILDIGEAIQEELGPHTCGYGKEELSAEIEKLDPSWLRTFSGRSKYAEHQPQHPCFG
jgi:hypothetical protein